MNGSQEIEIISLVIASSLVGIALLFSYWQKLELEKDTIISVIRAILQLIAVGFLLEIIFGLENPLFTALLLIIMAFNASWNASKRGKGIPNALRTSFIAISAGALITFTVLLLSNTIQFTPYQMIPIGGMIISNAMVALGLSYRQMVTGFYDKKDVIETKLALGADIFPASSEIIRDSIRTGMIPTIDSAKTLGIVSLPGMMTGLILAGTPPMLAIKYQIMVTFMLLSTTSIASFTACYLSYRYFFNKRKQVLST